MSVSIEKLRTFSPIEYKALIETVGAEHVKTDYPDIINSMSEKDWIDSIEMFHQELENDEAFYTNFYEWLELHISNYIVENGLN